MRAAAVCSFSVRFVACFLCCNRTNTNAARRGRDSEEQMIPLSLAKKEGRLRAKKHVLDNLSVSAAPLLSRAIALLVLATGLCNIRIRAVGGSFCCSITRKSCLVIRLLSISVLFAFPTFHVCHTIIRLRPGGIHFYYSLCRCVSLLYAVSPCSLLMYNSVFVHVVCDVLRRKGNVDDR